MRSYQITSFGQPLELRCYDEPSPSGTEVLVRVDACGVCHSDLHIWSGYFDLGGGRRITLGERGVGLPFTMGHEIVGEVVAAGPDAGGVAIGARAICYPWIGCGTCRACTTGHELRCPNPRTLGTRRNGGYSDHVLVPHPRYLVPFDGIDPARAATLACSGLTAYSALRKLPPVAEDDTILIVGAGGVGLACIGLAATLLPGRVVAADLSREKRDAALAAGASAALDGTASDALAAITAVSGRPPVAAIDFVGAPETVRLAMSAVAVGGTVVVVGLFGGEVAVSTALLPLRQITVMGSYVGTLQELRDLVAHVRERSVESLPVATRPMSDVNAILTDLQDGRITGRCVMIPSG